MTTQAPRKAVVALRQLKNLGGRAPLMDFALVQDGGRHGTYNAAHVLRQRGYVEDDGTVTPYRGDETYTGPRIPLFVMTEAGKKALGDRR